MGKRGPRRMDLRIALELNSVLASRYSGFYTYGAGLLGGFSRLADAPTFAFFCGRKAFVNAQWLKPLLGDLDVGWHVSRLKMRHLGQWWRWFDAPALQRFVGDFDLYHCNHHLMAPTRRKPRVLTVHDLRRYRYREFYPHSKLEPFESAVRRADHFIAISQSTKNDLQEVLGISADRIDVVYHGGPVISGPAGPAGNARGDAEQSPTGAADVLTQLGLRAGRYFVVQSSYDRRKNVAAIARAFAQAAPQLPDDFRLAIVGDLPRDEDVLADAQVSAVRDQVVCCGLVDDFLGLLSTSAGLVYASFYEGFGLPIIEAMQAGVPVITSNCSSMPEVAGPAALLVEPGSTDDIAAAMLRLTEETGLRERLVAAGLKRAGEFSWERAAAETLAVYRKLI